MIETIKEHRLQHGNVMHGIEKLMAGEKADIMYSDPPWGEGNIKYWQTINMKMNNVTKREDESLDAFITQIMKIGQKYVKNIMLIEYGVRWKDYIIEKAKEQGFKSIAIIEMFYKSGSRKLPLHLHIFAKKPITLPAGYMESVKGTHGIESVKRALLPLTKKGELVLDPCCGLGNTARICKEGGLRFYGNELNKARLEETAKRLRKP